MSKDISANIYNSTYTTSHAYKIDVTIHVFFSHSMMYHLPPGLPSKTSFGTL